MWKKKLYVQNNLEPFPLSRTKLELYLDCRKCFYNDLIYGIRRPLGPPLVLNSAIHQIVTNEFDNYRIKGEKHPIMNYEDFDMLPSNHTNLKLWRNPFTGIRHLDKRTNFNLYGSLDDLWIEKKKNEYLVVAYKITSKKHSLQYENINENYWRQLSFYKYLLKENNLIVSDIGFIIFLNAKKDVLSFNNRLSFEMNLFSKELNISWIKSSLENAFNILQSSSHPPPSSTCKYCQYVNLVNVLK